MSTQKDNNQQPDFKEIGKIIKSFRLEKGIKSEEFAKQLGISYPTLSRVENGHHGPSAAMLQKLSSLGMDISDISFASRSHSKEQTLSYRLAEVENKLAKMEDTVKKLIAMLKERE
jgi:HTH-type transcriptional regulator/antitoxin PezA